MKLSSVIFLIVSVVIIIAGISCTVIADNISKDDGIKIYNVIKDDSGDYVCEYVFENFLPEKISLSAEKLTVNVYGNSDENKIVYKNFPKGTFTLSYSNRVFELKTNKEFLDEISAQFCEFKLPIVHLIACNFAPPWIEMTPFIREK